MTKFNLYRIKKDKLSEWRDWCDQIDSTLKGEAEETLIAEGILYETFFDFQIDGVPYAIGLEFEMPNTNPEARLEPLPINLNHRRIKKACLEPVDSETNLGYDLLNPSIREFLGL